MTSRPQGADVLVLPEYGLTGSFRLAPHYDLFLELTVQVPPPAVAARPCEQHGEHAPVGY